MTKIHHGLMAKFGKKIKSDYNRLKRTRCDLVEPIILSKEKLYLRLSAKFSYPSASAKTYWSILKTFVDGKEAPFNTTF